MADFAGVGPPVYWAKHVVFDLEQIDLLRLCYLVLHLW